MQVFGTETCAHCLLLKSYLQGVKYPFKYFDMAKESEEVSRVRRLIAESGIKQLPIVLIDGEYIGSYREAMSFVNSKEAMK